jgi:hypothetical protein
MEFSGEILTGGIPGYTVHFDTAECVWAGIDQHSGEHRCVPACLAGARITGPAGAVWRLTGVRNDDMYQAERIG